MSRPCEVEAPAAWLRHVDNRRIDLARSGIGELRYMDGRCIRAGQLSADIQWGSVAWEPDDPQHFVGPVRRMAGPQRVAEDEAGCGLIHGYDVGKDTGIVVGPSFVQPGGFVTLVKVGSAATTWHDRCIGREALRRLCGRRRVRRSSGLARTCTGNQKDNRNQNEWAHLPPVHRPRVPGSFNSAMRPTVAIWRSEPCPTSCGSWASCGP